jgi:Rrf2 family protein
MFSKSCEYALQGVIYIALHSQGGKNVGLKEIAESQEIPLHFLSKILQLMVKHNILTSIKGPNGGFSLKKNPDKLYLTEIVEITDGTGIFDRCGIGLKDCSDKTPCPIHFDYKVVKEKIRDLLQTKSLSALIQDIESGKSIVAFH